jgi:hypothetical protein
MAMVYQKGRVFEKGKRIKKWYGQFRVYRVDREGKEVERTRKVVLGLKLELRKYQARRKSSRKSSEEKMAKPDRLFRSVRRMMQ